MVEEADAAVIPVHKGIDVGTNMMVSGYMNDNGEAVFHSQRDAFYRIDYKSEVNSNLIKISLDKRDIDYVVDSDGAFTVIGDDALDIAIERRGVAERPLSKGVISPKSKKSLPIIKLIIKSLLGEAVPGSKVVYSVPATPIDDEVDTLYHTEILNQYLESLGYIPKPINEAFAVGLSELLNDGLTGLTCSLGAGMTNFNVIVGGDPLISFGTAKSGDYIDNGVAIALDMSPSDVLREKEFHTDLYNPNGDIAAAIAVYYNNVIKYTLESIAYELKRNEKKLPVFKEGVPFIVSGGLTLADGFVGKFEECLNKIDFPIKISEVRKAADPMTACANGALLAANL